MHLYSREDISRMLRTVGFTAIAFENDFMNRQLEGDFGGMTKRILVLAEKSEAGDESLMFKKVKL